MWYRFDAVILAHTTVPSLFGTIECDIPIGTSDHSSIRFELLVASRHRINGSRSSERRVSNVKYNWHQGDYDAISVFLSGIDWLSVIHSNPSALVMCEVFISILYAAIDMYVPCHSQRNVNRSGHHEYRTREISRCTAKSADFGAHSNRIPTTPVSEPRIGSVHISCAI